MEQKKQEKVKTKKFMNRNVTEFRHFIKNSYITQNDLNWVINLRDNHIPAQITHTEPQPPEVFFKKTKAFEIRCKSQERQDNKTHKNHKNELSHMVWRDKNNTKQTEQQLNFYSTLRKNQKYNSVTAESTPKNFDNYAFKDRKQLPTFIKKESIRKLRQLTDKDKQPALDGAHKQNPYTENILQTKNYALLQVFTKKHGRSEVSLPTLAWQTGLRNYRA